MKDCIFKRLKATNFTNEKVILQKSKVSDEIIKKVIEPIQCGNTKKSGKVSLYFFKVTMV